MCAIISWCGPISERLLRDLFKNAAPRGPHAVGLSYIDDSHLFDNLRTFKRAVTPSYFLRNCNHRIKRASRFKLGFGHVRWATHGANIDQNAHPFEHDGITFIHNGVIQNYHSLMPTAIVDSECLGPLIRDRSIHLARGSVATIWLEHNKLHAYRNDHQDLMAIRVFNPDQTITLLIVTHLYLIPEWYLANHHQIIELAPFTAYQAIMNDAGAPSLVKQWSDAPFSSYHFGISGFVNRCCPAPVKSCDNDNGLFVGDEESDGDDDTE